MIVFMIPVAHKSLVRLFFTGKQFGITKFVNSKSCGDKPISLVSFLLVRLLTLLCRSKHMSTGEPP